MSYCHQHRPGRLHRARDCAGGGRQRARGQGRCILAAELATVDGRFVAAAEAVRAVRLLRGGPARGRPRAVQTAGAGEALSRAGLCGFGALHAALLAGLRRVDDDGCGERAGRDPARADATCGWCFSLRRGLAAGAEAAGSTACAAARAKTKGRSVLRSPVPPPRRITASSGSRAKADPAAAGQGGARPASDRPPPPAPAPAPLPQVVAPVAPVPADDRDRAGRHRGGPEGIRQPGPGTGAGAGTGQGTGMGEGSGSGIGPGSGGGTGGGPYRAGRASRRPDCLGK